MWINFGFQAAYSANSPLNNEDNLGDEEKLHPLSDSTPFLQVFAQSLRPYTGLLYPAH